MLNSFIPNFSLISIQPCNTGLFHRNLRKRSSWLPSQYTTLSGFNSSTILYKTFLVILNSCCRLVILSGFLSNLLILYWSWKSPKINSLSILRDFPNFKTKSSASLSWYGTCKSLITNCSSMLLISIIITPYLILLIIR